MRVLYVDDDRVLAVLFEEACRAAGGLEVHTAGSGAEAIEIVRDFTPDLLVIDLHLPDTDGLALLPALRDALDSQAAAAVLCTADASEQLSAKARKAGFSACWTKPVAPRHLLSELSRRQVRTTLAPG